LSTAKTASASQGWLYGDCTLRVAECHAAIAASACLHPLRKLSRRKKVADEAAI
jgi:hypothetical protein